MQSLKSVHWASSGNTEVINKSINSCDTIAYLYLMLVLLYFKCRTFTCIWVFLHCCISTWPSVKDLSHQLYLDPDWFKLYSCLNNSNKKKTAWLFYSCSVFCSSWILTVRIMMQVINIIINNYMKNFINKNLNKWLFNKLFLRLSVRLKNVVSNTTSSYMK